MAPPALAVLFFEAALPTVVAALPRRPGGGGQEGRAAGTLAAVSRAEYVLRKLRVSAGELVRAHVDAIEAMDDVEHIYPGHGEPIGKAYLAPYRDYLAFFEAEVAKAKDTASLIKSVWSRHQDWRSLAGLRFSAAAYISARDDATPEVTE